MSFYNFKQIQVVPSSTDFVDIVLSKTQRKTPTVVHPGYKISRIRTFYLRKVKFTQQSYHDKITEILDSFPKLDDVHPFYADLMNVLYDRDHYKIALGQLNTARMLIDNVAKDYARLLKYGDSLYRCKQLKRAALGRMCTIMKRQKSSLGYLEQVRQHLSRLPSIDPTSRTLILCGFPNVGKSSFMNKVTRADVEVQPYAFTTKSLFLGHLDYKYLRWQVMDTPGILDHALEERNTIEMQSITAMAHLKATIIYVLDVSEECGYNIEEQISLFESIKVLFSNKPVVLALNKIDIVRPDDLSPEKALALKEMSARNPNVNILTMSTMTEENLSAVKTKACELLLEQRVDAKINTGKVNEMVNRLSVAMPTPRDNVNRPAFVPKSVNKKRAQKESNNVSDTNKAPSLHERYVDECELFDYDWRQEHILANPEWQFDTMPEIMDGRNVADFIDPDILKRLEELEEEEVMRDEQGYYEFAEETDDRDVDVKELAQKIRHRRNQMIQSTREKKTKQGARLPRAKIEQSALKSHLSSMGIDVSSADSKMDDSDADNIPIGKRTRGRSEGGANKRSKGDGVSISRAAEASVSRAASRAQTRSRSRATDGMSEEQVNKVNKMTKVSQRGRNLEAKKGEGDRVIVNLMPKHLFSGKRGIGKTDRR